MTVEPTPESIERDRPRRAEPAGTIGGVLTDLAEIAGRLPVPADRAEHVARILDRLAEEIAEAAAMLRDSQDSPDSR